MLRVEIPGDKSLELEHLVLDMNGTITHRGRLLDGVSERLRSLEPLLTLHLLTSDTFGTADQVSNEIGARLTRVSDGGEKASFVRALGSSNTVALGNGRNDESMMRVAGLGIAVIGREGAWLWTIHVASLVCTSVQDALDLLVDTRLLVAGLRR